MLPVCTIKYTTDFIITKIDGDIAIRECVRREHITRPLQIKMLDASFEYWTKRGINDWGIVIDKENTNDENK